jgi:hypothetical protein
MAVIENSRLLCSKIAHTTCSCLRDQRAPQVALQAPPLASTR